MKKLRKKKNKKCKENNSISHNKINLLLNQMRDKKKKMKKKINKKSLKLNKKVKIYTIRKK